MGKRVAQAGLLRERGGPFSLLRRFVGGRRRSRPRGRCGLAFGLRGKRVAARPFPTLLPRRSSFLPWGARTRTAAAALTLTASSAWKRGCLSHGFREVVEWATVVVLSKNTVSCCALSLFCVSPPPPLLFPLPSFLPFSPFLSLSFSLSPPSFHHIESIETPLSFQTQTTQ